MNNGVKFRGLRTDGKGWVYGDLLQNYIHHQSGATIQQGGCIVYEVIKETVGQYIATIGKDVDVYIGDSLVNPKGRVYTAVIWDNIPQLHYDCKGDDFYSPMTNGFLANKAVIGNIHEEVSNG